MCHGRQVGQSRVDPSLIQLRRLGSWQGADHSAGGNSPANGIDHVLATIQRRAQNTAKRIPRANRINWRNRQCRDLETAPGMRGHDTRGTDGDNPRAPAQPGETAREIRFLQIRATAKQPHSLFLVGDENIDIGEHFPGKRPERRIVENHPAALRPRLPDGRLGLRLRQFHLQEQGRLQGQKIIPQPFRGYFRVRAAGDEDLILATCLYGDHSRAGHTVNDMNAGGVNPGLLQRRHTGGGIRIASNGSDETDIRPVPRRRNRLISPLAAGTETVPVGQNSFSRPGQFFEGKKDVCINRSEHDDHDLLPSGAEC